MLLTGLLSLLSYRTQDHRPGVAPPTLGWVLLWASHRAIFSTEAPLSLTTVACVKLTQNHLLLCLVVIGSGSVRSMFLFVCCCCWFVGFCFCFLGFFLALLELNLRAFFVATETNLSVITGIQNGMAGPARF